MKPNFRMRPNSQKDVKVKNTTKKFVLEALKWGGGILLASLFLNVGCIKKEDPVKKYIQTLENNKDAFLDSEKESICFEARMWLYV
jgi:hypothetical protein